MEVRDAVDFLSKAFYVTMLIVGPLLLSGLVIGLIIAIFQSVTQIQEMTLTFIPKMIIVSLVFVFLMPWMLETMVDFTNEAFNLIIRPKIYTGAP